MQQAQKDPAEEGTHEDQESHNSDTQLFGILTEESEDQNPPSQPQEDQSANQGQKQLVSQTQYEEIKEDMRSRPQMQHQQSRTIRQSESSTEIPISLDNLPEHIRSKIQKFTIFRDQGDQQEQQTGTPNRIVEEEKKEPQESKSSMYTTPVISRPPRHPDSGERGGGGRGMASAYHTVTSSRGGLFQDSRPFIFHRLSNSSPLEDRGRQARVPLQKLREPDSIIKRLDFDQSQFQHNSSSPGKPKWGHLNSRSLPR